MSLAGNGFNLKLLFTHISTSFTEPNADIEVLDIPVNAVATALKDFFSKHLPSLFEKDVMKELEEIAGEWPYRVAEKESFHTEL